MRYVILSIGSAGDVHPFVALGRRLVERGHDVSLLTNAHFRPTVERAGVRFVELGDEAEYETLMADPLVWHWRRGTEMVLRVVAERFEQTLDLLEAEVARGPCAVIASSLGLVARLLQEARGVPLVMVHLSPSILRSNHVTPVLAGLRLGWLPGPVLNALWRTFDRMIDKLLAPLTLDPLRERLGLPTQRRFLAEWWHSRPLTLGLWPDWYAPPQPDWPPPLSTSGFANYDGGSSEPLEPALDAWLADGPPPLLFTAGSAHRHASAFFTRCVEVCRRMDRRGLLLCAPVNLPADPLPDTVLHRSYVPFSQVLGRAAAFVHHGGIGTVSQALRAAVPQLVVPFAHDQFDNAIRLERLGVGGTLKATRFTPRRAIRRLARLVDVPAVAARARALAAKLEGVDPVGESCDRIEAYAGATA